MARHKAAGKLTVRERIDACTDAQSFVEVGSLTGSGQYDGLGRLTDFTPSNLIMGRARVGGRPVVVVGDDFTVRGGANDGAVGDKLIDLDAPDFHAAGTNRVGAVFERHGSGLHDTVDGRVALGDPRRLGILPVGQRLADLLRQLVEFGTSITARSIDHVDRSGLNAMRSAIRVRGGGRASRLRNR